MQVKSYVVGTANSVDDSFKRLDEWVNEELKPTKILSLVDTMLPAEVSGHTRFVRVVIFE